MEQALALNPGDSDLRFKLAFRYSEKDWMALAAFHYDILVRRSKPNTNALNNLAVALKNLGLTFEATRLYEQAVEEGSATAAGNLANMAVTGGLLTYARQMIDKTQELDPSEESAEGAAARLNRDVAREKTDYEATQRSAKQARKYVANLTRGQESLPSGQWRVGEHLLLFGPPEDGSVTGVSADGSIEVRIHDSDDLAPMTIHWIKGPHRGYQGPIAIASERLEGVLVDSSSGKVKPIDGNPEPGPTNDQD